MTSSPPRPPGGPALRVGVVEAHATADDGRPLAAVTVRYPDLRDHEGAPLVAGPFQVVQPFAGAGGPRAFRLPAVGQLVVVAPLPNGSGWAAADADGPTDCVVLGAVYPDAAPLPTDDPRPESDVVAFPDGTRVEYHPVAGLTVDCPLPVTVRSGEAVYLGGEDGAEGVARWKEVKEELDALRQQVAAHMAKPAAGGHPDPAAAQVGLPVRDRGSDHTKSTL